MSDDDLTGPWTCPSCGTDNQEDDEHCQQCDRWRTDEYGPDEYDDEESECGLCGGPLASDGACADDSCGADDNEETR